MKQIYKVEKFVNEEGKMIEGLFPLNDASKSPKFFGTIMLRMPEGSMPFEFSFDEGKSLEQCFEEFEAKAKGEIEKMAEEMNKPKIMTASANDIGGLIKES